MIDSIVLEIVYNPRDYNSGGALCDQELHAISRTSVASAHLDSPVIIKTPLRCTVAAAHLNSGCIRQNLKRTTWGKCAKGCLAALDALAVLPCTDLFNSPRTCFQSL